MKTFWHHRGPGSQIFGYVAVTALALGALTRCGSSTDTATTSATTTTTVSKVCPTSPQPECPSVVPSYKGEVQTIIATYCLECHDPNGVGAATTGYGAGKPPTGNPNTHMAGNPNRGTGATGATGFNDNPNNWDATTGRDWTNFANITREHVDMMQQVFLCAMPPASATALDANDRITLMNWLKCGAPNN